jgi:predicted DsbA family dithiol-disulfide isomerase
MTPDDHTRLIELAESVGLPEEVMADMLAHDRWTTLKQAWISAVVMSRRL